MSRLGGPYVVVPVDHPFLEAMGWDAFALLDHAIRKVRPEYRVAELVQVDRVAMPAFRRLVFQVE